jgi:hypothetical protein
MTMNGLEIDPESQQFQAENAEFEHISGNINP